jgi:Domain of unknown function (DUF4174)
MQISKNKLFSSRPLLLGRAFNLAVILFSIAAAAMTAEAKTPNNGHRSLIIFAPDMLSKNLSKQLSAMAGHQDDLGERAISLIYVVGRSVSAQLGSDSITPAVKLRAHFKVGNGEFRAILVAENGEVEMLSDTPITADQLFQTTDAVAVEHKAEK